MQQEILIFFFFLSSLQVKRQFYQYFSDGLTPKEAAAYHETKIQEEMPSESLADAKINPTICQIYYMHMKWKRRKHKQQQSHFKISQKKQYL